MAFRKESKALDRARRDSRRNFLKGTLAASVVAALSPAKALLLPGGNAVAARNIALGANLNQPNYYSPEQPFLNIVLNNSISSAFTARGGGGNGWLTSTYGNYTGTVDSNGWPTQIQDGIHNQFLILRNLPQSNGGTGARYRSGTYYVFYNGTGTVTYSFDATLSSHASGSAYGYTWMDTLTVSSPSANGIQINVTATGGAGSNISGVAVVHSTDLAAWAAGGIFSPAFLTKLSALGPLRTMDWRNTNSNTWIKNWTDEPTTAQGGYGDCVPWSIIVALANQARVPALWVNIPMNATVAYVTALMNYLAANLNAGISLFVEYANEVWNGTTSVFGQALANGQALWSNWATYGNTATAMSYEGYMLQQACTAAVSAFGSANVGPDKRVQIIAGAQYTNGGILDDVMTTPVLVANGGRALYGNYPVAGSCVGWYFNISAKHIPASWLSDSASTFITNAYSEFTTGGLIPQDGGSGYGFYTATIDYIVNQMATKYGSLPVLGYEGGQGETPNNDFNQLYNNTLARNITRSTAYTAGTYALDPSYGLQKCTTAGTTAASAPTFNETTGGTTADGTAAWTRVLPASMIVRSTGYSTGAYKIDPNGNLQVCTSGGTTAVSAPAYSNTLGAVTTDGGSSWMRVQSATGVWQATWAPTVGDVIIDPNGNYQMAMTVTGATGSSQPVTWGTTPLSTTSAGSQTTDGGVTWLCIRDDSWTTLELDYARSSQIASAYSSCMNYWKGKGPACRYLFQFNDCFPPSKYGLWGATESFEDTISPLASAPEKWQAVAGWAASNPKWW